LLIPISDNSNNISDIYLFDLAVFRFELLQKCHDGPLQQLQAYLLSADDLGLLEGSHHREILIMMEQLFAPNGAQGSNRRRGKPPTCTFSDLH
jgi:hypothetical protein